MEWWHISIVLCAHGFLKEFRPSEPFISPFLTETKNFTIAQVNQDIYPLGTYFYLFLLIAVFLLTDYLRYKPVLLAGGASAIITWSLLVWGTTIREMQIVEFFYGFFMASEVAYYSYIYAKVDKEHYQKVTSHTRGAFLLGKASAGLSSQLFVLFNVLNYLQLNYVTVAGVAGATLVAFFLPTVPQSIYFHRKKSSESQNFQSKDGLSCDTSEKYFGKKDKLMQCRTAFTRLYVDFREAFTNRYVLQWSIWWALATCGYLQAVSYCQLLWEDIRARNTTLYHGFVEFISSFLGAGVAFAIGYLKVPWNKWGELALGILTLGQGGLLFYSAYLTDLYVAYAVQMGYQLLYHAAITVATYEIAKCINEDSYALIFGINTFVALILQTILTAVCIDALKMNIRTQFEVYGGYHLIIGSGFLVIGFFLCST